MFEVSDRVLWARCSCHTLYGTVVDCKPGVYVVVQWDGHDALRAYGWAVVNRGWVVPAVDQLSLADAV